MKKSQIFLLCAFSFIMGITAGLIEKIDYFFLFLFFSGLIILIISFWHNISLRILCFAYLIFTLGIFRANLGNSIFIKGDLGKYNKAKAEISGVILDEPRLNYSSQEFKMRVEKNSLGNLACFKKILVRTKLYPRYFYGDRIKVKCKMAAISYFENIRIDKQLSLEGIYLICYADSAELADKNNGIGLYKNLLLFKDKLRYVIFKNVNAPESQILASILLGDTRALSDDLKNSFNNAGVSYILSMPGIRIGILVLIILAFLNFIGISRKHAYPIALPVIFLYLVLIGFSISALRVAIMIALVFFAAYWGRLAKSLNLLLLAASLILLWKPGVLFYDLGFQFSFIGMAGIIIIIPILRKKLNFIKNDYLNGLISLSLAAWLSTLPLTAYYFGIISIASLIAGIIIIWIIPIVFIFGLLLFMAALIAPFLGWLINVISLCLSFFIKYIIFAVKMLNVKVLIFSIGKISFWQAGILYFLLLVFIKANGKDREEIA